MNNKKTNLLAAAVLAAVGGASVSQTATAEVLTFDWTGMWSRLGDNGAAWANNSLSAKGSNQFITPITGTLTYDTVTGTGTASVAPFQFLNGNPTLPYTFEGINLQAIGDGMGGTGPLILANMLYSWNSSSGIPVSLVWDGTGFFQAIDAGIPSGFITGIGSAPAIDGTYTNPTFGYIQLGPTPLATTSYDTTNINGCVELDCSGINPSGGLPLIMDTAMNVSDYDLTTPTLSDLANEGIGGSPQQTSPFFSANENINITTLVLNPNQSSQTTRIRSWVRPADTNPGTESFYVENSNSPGNWDLINTNVYWGIANLMQTAYSTSYSGDIFLGKEAYSCLFCPADFQITAAVVDDGLPVANTVNSISAFSMDNFSGWASINIGGTETLITTHGDSVSVAMAALTKGATVTYSSRSVIIFNSTTNMLESQPGWLQDLIAN